ncbi:hypothetical protein EKD04_013555 [Chloroflexales bacterium ZM16-3]|nr:hypothetical protein [Chloroflexales bacterium ZM16-3]
MENKHSAASSPTEPVIYQLRLQGRLGADWSDWLEGMTVSPAENGDTLVTGLVIDQATLHGLLRKVRDLGIPLLAVNRIQPGQTGGPVGSP